MNIITILLSLFSVVLATDTECPLVTTQEDRRKANNTLRLVQYNVEWLFVDYYSAFNCPGSQCSWNNTDEALKHLDYVSDVIGELQPDIIHMCEVEGCDELGLLIDNLHNPNYKGYLKKGTDASTGQNVAMLTKVDPMINLYRTENRSQYPIPGSQCGYSGSGDTGVSKHMITEFFIENTHIAFIGAHFVAIPTDPSRCAQREGQAQVLQHVIYDYIKKQYEIIMIGDFNDYDGEILDVNSNKPTSKVLDILKGNYGELGGKYQLLSALSEIPQEARFTDWWDSDSNCATSSIKDYSMIDHILLTENLKNKISNAFIYHGYLEFCGKYNSDHYPVVLDFVF